MQTQNRTIKVTANNSKRTFTIRTFINGKLNAKYRTSVMSKSEFEIEQYNTENDWAQFLKSGDYYEVK